MPVTFASDVVDRPHRPLVESQGDNDEDRRTSIATSRSTQSESEASDAGVKKPRHKSVYSASMRQLLDVDEDEELDDETNEGPKLESTDAWLSFNTEFAPKHKLKLFEDFQDVNEIVDRVKWFVQWFPHSPDWIRMAAHRLGSMCRRLKFAVRKSTDFRALVINDVLAHWRIEEEKRRKAMHALFLEEPWRQSDEQNLREFAELNIEDDIKKTVVKSVYFRERRQFTLDDDAHNAKVHQLRQRYLRNLIMANLKGQLKSDGSSTLSGQVARTWTQLQDTLHTAPRFNFTPERITADILIQAWRELLPTLRFKVAAQASGNFRPSPKGSPSNSPRTSPPPSPSNKTKPAAVELFRKSDPSVRFAPDPALSQVPKLESLESVAYNDRDNLLREVDTAKGGDTHRRRSVPSIQWLEHVGGIGAGLAANGPLLRRSSVQLTPTHATQTATNTTSKTFKPQPTGPSPFVQPFATGPIKPGKFSSLHKGINPFVPLFDPKAAKQAAVTTTLTNGVSLDEFRKMVTPAPAPSQLTHSNVPNPIAILPAKARPRPVSSTGKAGVLPALEHPHNAAPQQRSSTPLPRTRSSSPPPSREVSSVVSGDPTHQPKRDAKERSSSPSSGPARLAPLDSYPPPVPSSKPVVGKPPAASTGPVVRVGHAGVGFRRSSTTESLDANQARAAAPPTRTPSPKPGGGTPTRETKTVFPTSASATSGFYHKAN